MVVIGITGGIGSGKSAAMHIIEQEYGAKILLADNIGHLAMAKGSATYEAMVKSFGTSIIDSNGEINRLELGTLLLASPEKLAIQNGIVHPFVIDYIEKQLRHWKNEGVRLAVVESALLVQSGCNRLCDEVWLVTAPREVRIQRLIAARGYSLEQAESFMKRQQTEDAYKMHCNRVICNDGDIENLYKELRKCIEQTKGM